MLQLAAFTFNPAQENTYILYNENKKAIIIDPGCFTEHERTILANFITKNELQPVQLINTHCHLDHVFGNKWVYETYGLPLYLHPLDEPVLLQAESSAARWGVSIDVYSGPLHFLHHGDLIALAEDSLQVIHIPGHSPGSIGFYSPSQGFIISGDVLFKESIGRTDLWGGNLNTLLESIKQQLWVLPNETKVYSGHGDVTTIGYEKQYNPFLNG